jgi:hypothetical protein
LLNPDVPFNNPFRSRWTFDFNLLKPQFAHKDVEAILESDDDE